MEENHTVAIQSMKEANSWLSALHTFELTANDTFKWPGWMATQEQWASYYQQTNKTFDLSTFDMLPRKILNHAATIRGLASEPEQDLFGSSSTAHGAISALPYSFKVELLFAAFEHHQHSLVIRLAQDLLKTSELNEKATERLNMLLMEMVVYAQMRLENKGFIEDPTVLSGKVEHFLNTPDVRALTELETTSSAKVLGCYYCFKGDLNKASYYMERAYTLGGFRSLVFQPVKTVVNIPNLITLAECKKTHTEILDWYDEQVLLNVFLKHDGVDDHIILVSGDERYFTLYGQNFTEVIGLSNPGILVHFHLVNMPDETGLATLFEEWEQKYSVRINYTLETNKMLAENPAMLRGASANTRFSSLPIYLKHYAGVITCDIDGWIDKHLSSFIDHSKADVLVTSGIWSKFNGGWRLPWACIAASPMSFKATAPGKKAAGLIAFYIKYLNWRAEEKTGQERDLFWADQSATFLVLEHLFRKKELSLGFAGRGFGQGVETQTQDRATSRQKGTREVVEKLKKEQKTTPIAKLY